MESLAILSKLKKSIPEKQIFLNEPMSRHTTFKIGGPAKFLVKIKSIKEIQNIIRIAKEYNLDFYIIGQGSNILVTDKGIDGIVIKIELDNIKIEEKSEIDICNKKQGEKSKIQNKYKKQIEVVAEAGVKLGLLAQKLCLKGISGFEFASGIPGTIGGAIKMNAGAYGKEMKDIVVSTTYMDLNGNIYEIPNEENEFEYRYSRFIKENLIILSAKLRFEEGKIEEIQNKMNDYKKIRQEKQPYTFPSAGSTFKRGKDYITAKLIDECGLKGFSVGGAEVSTKHAGFIVNKGNATANDVIELIEKVKEVVKNKTNKEIQLEIQIIGIK